MAKSWTPTSAFTRALVLALALVAVLYGVHRLNSPEAPAGLAFFFGERPAKNWCDNDVESVQVIRTSEVVNEATRVRSLCWIAMDPVAAEDLVGADFSALLRSVSKSGERILEGDLQKGVFRASGLPFRSMEFADSLSKMMRP